MATTKVNESKSASKTEQAPAEPQAEPVETGLSTKAALTAFMEARPNDHFSAEELEAGTERYMGKAPGAGSVTKTLNELVEKGEVLQDEGAGTYQWHTAAEPSQ